MSDPNRYPYDDSEVRPDEAWHDGDPPYGDDADAGWWEMVEDQDRIQESGGYDS